MIRAIIDLRSVLWTALLAGKDVEFGRKISFNGKEILVNSAHHGYENAVDHIILVLEELKLQPRDIIFVDEGRNSKLMRQTFFPDYKAGRDRAPEQYEQFNLCKQMVLDAFLGLGAQLCWQDGMEADDVIAYVAKKLQGERYIVTNDGDLAVCIDPDNGVHLFRQGRIDYNPYGPFSPKLIPVYKALVGDSSDGYGGAYKFGDAAFLKVLEAFGEEGLELLEKLIIDKQLSKLAEDVGEVKELQKVMDGAESVYTCYALARLHVEKVNTMRKPLQWRAGMVKPVGQFEDERLRKWAGQVRLIHAGNYEAGMEFLRKHLPSTPELCLDLETYVGEESEEWLSRRSKKGAGVDVLGSMITGCGLTFGANGQFGYYFATDHAETDKVKNIGIKALGDALGSLPKDKLTIAQNAAGFEIPVLFSHFGADWKDNGWRGFYPNMVDSRIAASYWDEDCESHGLKHLSKAILDYEQETYAEVTTIGGVQYNMHELTAEHVLSYGVDDVFCTQAIYNHFRVIMELDGTYDAFLRLEQKPMYLSAMSYVNGTNISLERLNELRKQDDKIYADCQRTLDAYLIDKKWEGSVCPVYKALDAAAVKEIFNIVTGQELKTMVRTVSKLAVLVEEAGFEVLGKLIANEDVETLNKLVEDSFDGRPDFDVASPKQVGKLLYDVIGIPVRLRNKATDTMRAKGIREGTARTDDDAIKMAQKMGDVAKDSDDYKLLSALMAMKSINTKRGLYYDPYPNQVHWKDGRLHPELVQSATNTRRWASRNPNIQQQDGEYNGIRSVVLPHKRNAVVVSLDEGAQEVRLCADYSKDANLMSCYVGDKSKLRDVHSIVASKIAGVSYDEFILMRKSADKEVASKADKIRGIAKIVLFASLYGAMAPKIGETLAIGTEEAQGYIDAIYSQFSSLAKWKQETESFAEKHGYVKVLGGTVRHLRKQLLSDNGYEQSKALRQAGNAKIQSAGANQIKTIMSCVWDSDLFEKYDFQWMFVVHDECVFSVSREDAAEVIKEIHGYMTAPFLESVPSASSIGIGRTFGTLTELGEEFDEAKIEAALNDIFEEKAAA